MTLTVTSTQVVVNVNVNVNVTNKNPSRDYFHPIHSIHSDEGLTLTNLLR